MVWTFLASPGSAVGQSGENGWVYALTSTEASSGLLRAVYFNVTRLNVASGRSEQLFSVTSPSQAEFATTLPQTEVGVARAILTRLGAKDLNNALTSKLDVTIPSMSVASSNQQVALNVRYQKCFHPGEPACFGASQVVVVSKTSKKVLWNLGFHSLEYAPKACGFLKDDPDFYLDIKSIQWTPDEKAIVAALGGDVNCFDPAYANWPLIVIPLADGAPAFSVGGARAWSISSDSRTIGAIVQNCQPPPCKDSVETMKFDLASQQVSRQNYSLNQYSFVNDRAGVAFVKGALLPEAFDTTKLDGGGGLMLFNPGQQPGLSISPRIQGGGKRIVATPDNDVALIESGDGSLWRATVEGGSIQARQIVKGPVVAWRVGRGKALLVRLKDDPAYSIIDEQGNTIGKIDVEAKIKATGQSIKSILLDW